MATKYIDILTTIDCAGYAHDDVLDGAENTLTVRQLIDQLSTCDPDALVFIRDGYIDGSVSGVDQA